MKSTLETIKQWFINYQSDIILVIGVILISLLSFAMGYIVARQQEKEPIKIEFYENSHHRCGDKWIIFSLETFSKRS